MAKKARRSKWQCLCFFGTLTSLESAAQLVDKSLQHTCHVTLEDLCLQVTSIAANDNLLQLLQLVEGSNEGCLWSSAIKTNKLPAPKSSVNNSDQVYPDRTYCTWHADSILRSVALLWLLSMHRFEESMGSSNRSSTAAAAALPVSLIMQMPLLL